MDERASHKRSKHSSSMKGMKLKGMKVRSPPASRAARAHGASRALRELASTELTLQQSADGAGDGASPVGLRLDGRARRGLGPGRPGEQHGVSGARRRWQPAG